MDLERAPLGDVLAGADHPDGLPVRVVEGPAGAVDPMDRPIGPDDAELAVVRLTSLEGTADAGQQSIAVVRMDHRQVLVEVLGRDPRRQAVLDADLVRPDERAAGDLPLPEAGPRGRKDEFEPVVEVPDERGEPFGLGAGGGQGTVDVMAVVIPGSLVCAGFGRHRGHHRTATGLHVESKRAARWAARRVHLRW